MADTDIPILFAIKYKSATDEGFVIAERVAFIPTQSLAEAGAVDGQLAAIQAFVEGNANTQSSHVQSTFVIPAKRTINGVTISASGNE